MKGTGTLVNTLPGLIADTAKETMALNDYINIVGHQQFHSTEKRMDIDFLILADDRVAQIQPQAATEGIQPGAMESLALIDILIGA